jgi:hypothetical protein
MDNKFLEYAKSKEKDFSSLWEGTWGEGSQINGGERLVSKVYLCIFLWYQLQLMILSSVINLGSPW